MNIVAKTGPAFRFGIGGLNIVLGSLISGPYQCYAKGNIGYNMINRVIRCGKKGMSWMVYSILYWWRGRLSEILIMLWFDLKGAASIPSNSIVCMLFHFNSLPIMSLSILAATYTLYYFWLWYISSLTLT